MVERTGIKLSICIPTYNFGKFIGQTLDTITSNLREGVEIVILDGGSNDDTESVVVRRQHTFPQIKYHRQKFRGGIDRDIAKVVDLSEGEYCWLFSADDHMKPGAVDKVLEYICSGCDVYLCEQTLCDFDMDPMKEYPLFAHIAPGDVFNLGDTQQRKKYFSSAKTSEAFFSFLSVPIFKKSIWERANNIPDSFYETCWALAGRLLSLARTGLTVYYTGASLIYKRSDNDSFFEHGAVNRLRITVEGFSHISETIFGNDSLENFHIRRVLRNERRLPHLLGIKLSVALSGQREKMVSLNNLVRKHYADAGIVNSCKYIIFRIVPTPLVKLGLVLMNLLSGRRIILRKA